ncbi:hypothetical protein [Fusobacterium necrophorum]|uniref:SMODS and SLOG-associating 2TM effector domain-containing protein n=1 Tax=Fusobacterium necrophorum subsp. funduliforme B35 TaxID=1226633 RepID=A0A017H2G4_9FUSO|nr:hypothetical protein [Fusobacterium necrophorum]AVQ20732.1 hypothetical protein C4N15_03375 [Fusobacterium necrophorum subsp. funduliforme]EYD68747.1 hypothetical protein FNF_08394 [Fusobacterium necrophorum subsp. funduliforme B35]KID48393.1 hypothetical protein C095_10635 [Fusobacterium necrophorum subsp. funduliforme B35]
MNLRKFNKRIDPWIGSILVFMMIGQAVLLMLENDRVYQIIGNVGVNISIAFLSAFLTIYANKTRHNANMYFNEVVEAYLHREYYIKEQKLEKEELKNDDTFKKLNAILKIKYEMFKIYSNNSKQNKELEKYIYEYEEELDKSKKFLKFIKEEITV